jgi:thiol:disulfide interchange protein DsbD
MPPNATKRSRPSAQRACLAAALVACVLAGVVASAQGTPPRRASALHVEVGLITSEPVLMAGRDVWLGVRFQLDPEWHIYWVNPGDSGGPPTVLWEAPAGVSVGDFEWPAPQRIPLGPLVNYGYTGDVVLPFPVKATAAAAGKPATLVASLRWLVCHDVCVPGRARLAITLPVAEADRGQTEAWRRSIGDARGRVPKPAPAAWKATARSTGADFSLVVTMDRPAPSSAVFFPLEVNQVNESARQDIGASGRQLRLTLRKSDQLGALPRILKGVLALPDGRAFVVEAPVGVESKSPSVAR